MSEQTRIPDLLEKAADVIDERGWHRGHYTDPDGRCVCVVGAISVAAGMAPDALGSPGKELDQARVAIAHAAVNVFEGWLASYMDGDRPDATDWNDEQAEDAAYVINELRACAAAKRRPTDA